MYIYVYIVYIYDMYVYTYICIYIIYSAALRGADNQRNGACHGPRNRHLVLQRGKVTRVYVYVIGYMCVCMYIYLYYTCVALTNNAVPPATAHATATAFHDMARCV